MNQIIIEGNVIEKPNYQTLGITSCLFSISNGEMTKEIDNFEVVAYGNLAEFSKKLIVGDNVRIIGRLKQKRWTDSNGKKCCAINIVAEHIEIRGGEDYWFFSSLFFWRYKND